MDSLTQIALGSAVGVAVMGRRTAVWKAALWGAIAGTLPDLDVVIDHGNPVLNMVRHRAESHSLFYLTLFAPLLAWVAAKVHGEMSLFKRWWLALWLVLVTHPLLDNMTVYGTQLLMPFTDHPFAVSSVFIIDPAYTLPLIVGVVAALRLKSDRGLRWNAVALALSTAYLGWSMVAQYQVTTIARAAMPAPNIAANNLLVTPSPFNTVLWRLVATTPEQYFEGYYSLLDPEPTVRWTAHPRGAELIKQHGEVDAVARIAAFSQGFFKMQTSANPGHVLLTDLRMGQEPSYTFSFDLGNAADVGAAPIQQRSMRADIGKALPWLWQRLLGHTQSSWVEQAS
ncbi:hydrolase [Hydrogenophaga crassostreae]|uniref:Hydrolase n=1 Tax=Hydrogenophaga crassostreae TaxID=1763535 RepID=A0A167GAA9_9BURK|nr:metal-dependent hydrolase [Hydrogenophaga crassostreae]AOW11578.1 hydrolase [Hydrogenophaga crassostreae]OAD39177.1 hydrolase [Hydrogenophaga crassostreae]